MQKEIKQGSEEFECFGEIFSLYKEIGQVEDTEEYWKVAIDKIRTYMEKHQNPLGRELGLAIMSVLNEEKDDQRYARLITLVGFKAFADKDVARDLTDMALKVSKKWMEKNG